MSIPSGLRPAAAAVVLLLSLASSLGAQLHKDERLGFQFKPPREFQAIAIEPTEKIAVAVYQREQADHTSSGLKIFPRFEVYFLAGEQDAEKGWQYLERRARGEVEREKSVTLAGVKTEERTIDGGARKFVTAVLPQQDGVFLFLGTASSDRWSKSVGDLSKATRSFKRIDVVDLSADLEGLSENERFLQEQIAALPPGWEWERSDRYLYLFNGDKGFIQRVSRQIESIRDEYERLFPPEQPVTAISIVRVCADPETYQGYGGPAGTNGYWSSSNRELVLFDRRPQEQTLETLNHEAFHQYIFYMAGELAPHSWYNEGHGDYFGGARMTRSFKVTAFEPRRYTQRHPVVKEAWRQSSAGQDMSGGGLIPLKTLMGWTQGEFYGPHKSLAYAEGWALVYMLREWKRLDEKYESLLDDYMTNLLAARDEAATALMKAAQDEAAKGGQEKAPEYADDARRYYPRVDRDEVQAAAFQKTFGDWTDEDWAAFDAAFFEFLDGVKG